MMITCNQRQQQQARHHHHNKHWHRCIISKQGITKTSSNVNTM